MTALEEIRAATRRSHEDLEAASDMVARLMSPPERRAALAAFHRLYVPAERALAPHLASVRDLDFDQRRKAPALARGLRTLGVAAAPPGPEPAGLPRFANVAQALGFAYVLEGATLGGQVIRKRLARAGVSLEGLDFFEVYGAETGRQWKRFCQVLERDCADHVVAAVEGALAGFAYMREGLVDAPAPLERAALG